MLDPIGRSQRLPKSDLGTQQQGFWIDVLRKRLVVQVV